MTYEHSKESLDNLFDSLIISDCRFILSDHNDGGMSLRTYDTHTLLHTLERSISLSLHREADIIRYELGLRNKISKDTEDMLNLLQGRKYNHE